MSRLAKGFGLVTVKTAPTTPEGVGPRVCLLAAELGLDDANAVFLPYSPTKAFRAAAQMCHVNVMLQCGREGGELRAGWVIWEHPSADFAEAVFHSVWQKDSTLHDITPRDDGEAQVLFLPDPHRAPERVSVNGQGALRVFQSLKIHQGAVIARPVPYLVLPDMKAAYGFAAGARALLD